MDEYKVNYCLSIVPHDGPEGWQLAFENSNRLKKHDVSDLSLVRLLDYASDWTPRADIEEFARGEFDLDGEESANLVDRCVENGFLVDRDSSAARLEERAVEWERYNWSDAADYYLNVLDFPFADYNRPEGIRQERERMAEYREDEEPPGPYRTYDDAAAVELPDPDEVTDEPSLWEGLDYSLLPGNTFDDDRDVDETLLSTLLYYTFGETGTISTPIQGEFITRTSPSGGARHPTEAYVAAFEVDGVDPGLYHYSVKSHSLERLDDDVRTALEEYAPELVGYPLSPSFVVLLTAVMERSMWRYREPRTYRVIHHDVGHLLETLRVTCNCFGLSSHFNFGFDDSGVEGLLPHDRFEEPVFGYAMVGNLDTDSYLEDLTSNRD